MNLLLAAMQYAASSCMQYPLLPLLALVCLLLYISGKPRGSIPCPWRFPVLGHIPYVAVMGMEGYLTWARRYGPVTEVTLGSYTFVLLNTTEAMRTAYLKKSLSIAGRPHNDIAGVLDKKYAGLGFSTLNKGTIFQRNFSRRVLKIVIADKRIDFKAMVSRHTTKFVENLLEAGEAPTDPKAALAVLNASVLYELWHGVPGEQLFENDFYKSWALFSNRVMRDCFSTLQLVTMWPWIRSLRQQKINSFCDYLGQIRDYFTSLNKQMVPKYKGDIRNGAEILYSESEKVPTEVMQSMNMKKEHLTERLLMDFTFAGLETTFRTMHWALLYLSLHPEVQDQMVAQLEILKLEDNESFYERRRALPFCEAVINEVLRCSCLTPLGLEHMVLENTEVLGHKLSPGTIVSPNMYGISRDPSVWDRPDEFRPQRFIDAEGKFNCDLAKNVIVFSIGKRSCVGEAVARKQLFLQICQIVMQCRLTVPKNDVPDLTRVVMLSVEANDFRVVAAPRNSVQ